MAADLAADACGNEQHGVEVAGVLDLSLDELEDRGAGRSGDGQGVGHLAQRTEISIIVGASYSEADRHSVTRELTRDRLGEIRQEVFVARHRRNQKLLLQQQHSSTSASHQKIVISESLFQDQLFRFGPGIDGRQVDSIEHVGLHRRVGARRYEHNSRADFERLSESIETEYVTWQARGARQDILEIRLLVITKHLGLELILEDLGHMAHRRIQDGDLAPVRGEQVDDSRDDVTGVPDERGSRLDEDLDTMLRAQQIDGPDQRPQLFGRIEDITTAEVDPRDPRQQP